MKVAYTAERRRIDRLVEYAERQLAQTTALNESMRCEVLAAHQMVLDAATEFRRSVHVLRRVQRGRDLAAVRALAREYLKEIGA